MRLPLAEVERRLQSLQEDRNQLPSRMRSASTQLRENSVAPDLSLITEMRLFRKRQRDLHIEFNGSNCEFDEHANLDRLEEQYRGYVQNESVNVVLHQAATLTHSKDDHVLDGVMDSIEQVRSALNQNDAKLIREEFQNGTHPVSTLVKLISDPESLDDESWGEHMERIENAFGRDVEIAVARGYLTIENKVQSSAEAESALID